MNRAVKILTLQKKQNKTVFILTFTLCFGNYQIEFNLFVVTKMIKLNGTHNRGN